MKALCPFVSSDAAFSSLHVAFHLSEYINWQCFIWVRMVESDFFCSLNRFLHSKAFMLCLVYYCLLYILHKKVFKLIENKLKTWDYEKGGVFNAQYEILHELFCVSWWRFGGGFFGAIQSTHVIF